MSRFTIRRWLAKKAAALGVILASAALIGGFSFLLSSSVKADSPDCNSNAVVYCGITTDNIGQLETEYNQNLNNANHPGSAGLQQIYASQPFGMSKSDMQAFFNSYKGTAPNGLVYSNGNVVVNGKTVATNALTGGLDPMPCDPNIPNEDPNSAGVYVRPPSCSFLSSRLQAFVYMPNGQFRFAVLVSCGNPVVATPVPVTPPVCDEVDVSESQNENGNVVNATVHFTPNGATFDSAKFAWNGSSNTTVATSSNNSASSSFTYIYNAFTVVVSLTFNQNGQTVTAGGPKCQVSNTFVGPTEQCTGLQVDQVSGDVRTIDATVSYKESNGSTFKGTTFYWGDGTSTETASTSARHTYAKYGTYKDIHAILNFEIFGKIYQINDAICANKSTTFVTPSTPTMACSNLTIDNTSEQNSELQVEATVFYKPNNNGAVFKSATIDWGDSSASVLSPTSSNDSVSASHTYSMITSYTATATVAYALNGVLQPAVSSSACSQPVPFTVTPPTTTPPATTVSCTTNNQNGSSGASSECVTQLTNTGPGSTMALFGGVSILAGAGHYLFRTKHLGRLLFRR